MALVLLTVVYTFGFIDRQIVTILAEPIKRELHLQDWHIGVLTGLSFALFYSILSLPVAALADRTHRPRLIAAALTTWSLFTAAAGFATNFTQLLIARIGVGLGEAGCAPPSHALIADYYPLERRAGAIGIYAMGISFGSLLGLSIGGIVLHWLGWRAAFIVVGLPGVGLALLLLTFLKEPRARLSQAALHTRPNMRTTLAALMNKLSFRWIWAGSALTSIKAYTLPAFMPAFFLRAHADGLAALSRSIEATFHVSVGTTGFLGLVLGIANGVAGATATVLGGRITDWLARRDLRAYLYFPAGTLILSVPLFVVALTIEDTTAAFALLASATFTTMLGYPAAYGSVQVLATSDKRASASALLFLAINLVGLGVGPLLAGAISDVFGSYGWSSAQSLRAGLFSALALGVVGALCLIAGARTFRSDAIKQ